MKSHILGVMGLIVAIPVSLQGLGLRIPDQDARAIARGNAFAATADNPSAIYYNPAGITQLEGLQTLSSAYLIGIRDTFTAVNGTEYKTVDRIQGVPQFYCTYSKTNWPVTFGAGVYAPYGLGTEWPNDSPFRQVTTQGSLEYLTFQPVIAWEVHSTLSLAAGPTVNYGKVDLRRGVLAVSNGDEFRFTGTDFNVGFSVGLRWQPHAKHAFGFVYRGPSSMDFDGKSYLTVPAAAISRVENANAGMDFPQQIVVGYSFRPTPNWNLEFNADWTDWDVLNSVVLEQTSPVSLPSTSIPFNYQSSFLFEWGVTRYFTHHWAASAGYIYSQNSVPTAFFNPAVADSDRHVFSAGFGQRYDRISWDATYQLSHGPSRDVDNSIQGATVSGRYRFISHAIAVSIGFAF